MADELEVKGIVEVVTDKAIKIGKDWFSTTYAKGDTVVKGDEVVLTYKKNKAFKNVSKITKVVNEAPKVETPKKEEPKVEEPGLKEPKTWGNKREYYGSPEDVAGKQKGCALGAAGAAVAGNFPGAQPADIAEAMIIIAKRGLEYLQE